MNNILMIFRKPRQMYMIKIEGYISVENRRQLIA